MLLIKFIIEIIVKGLANTLNHMNLEIMHEYVCIEIRLSCWKNEYKFSISIQFQNRKNY